MCGIYGIIGFGNEKIDQFVLQSMGGVLKHRGPDSSRIKLISTNDGRLNAGLGTNRLKIIDLSDLANQPLCNENEKIWITFNGEIYNYRELKKELGKKGHKFKSNSDTEVIVHLYEDIREECVKKLDGMFSFAIWDSDNNMLFCARDRSGKKPFYYYSDEKYFVFASEMKAIFQCPWVKKSIAVQNIPEYLTFGYIHAPYTMYKNIFHLSPASYLIVDKNGVKEPKKYWELKLANADEVYDIPLKEAVKNVREIFVKAVEKRLVSDVPLGLLLSGGLDSTIITAIVTRILNKDILTFNIGFEDNLSFDERRYAKLAAKYSGSRHTEFTVNITDIALLEKILWHYDEPCGDPSALPTFLISNSVRKHVTVALNGDGGDELFAGYDRFKAALMVRYIPQAVVRAGNYFSGMLPRTHGYYGLKRRMERFFDSESTNPLIRHHNWIIRFKYNEIKDLMNISFKDDLKKNIELDLNILRTVSNLPLLHRLLYLNFITYLPDNLNLKMDRMSMANSLETRSPMLDTMLVEYALKLPPEYKIKSGKTKYILREVFKDIVPKKILRREKHGFGIPLAAWFCKDLGKYFEEKMLSPTSLYRAYFNQEYIRRIYFEHLRRVSDHSYKLWLLLQFELWLRKM